MRFVASIFFVILIVFLFWNQLKNIGNKPSDTIQLEGLLSAVSKNTLDSEKIFFISNNSDPEFIYKAQFIVAPVFLERQLQDSFPCESKILIVDDLSREKKTTPPGIENRRFDTLFKNSDSSYSVLMLKITK